MFWKSVLAIVFYPFTALWNDVMMRDIYGIKPVQIFAMLAFGVALYRFIIVPFSSGINLNFGSGIAKFTNSHRALPRQAKIAYENGYKESNKIYTLYSKANADYVKRL